MIHPIRQLIRCELRCSTRMPAGSVVGFLIDDEAWALPYIVVRLSGDTRAEIRLLPSSAFPAIADFDGRLVACLTRRLGGTCIA